MPSVANGGNSGGPRLAGGIRRCAFMLVLLFGFVATAYPGAKGAGEHQAPLRLGITPAMVLDRYDVIEEWRAYLQRRVGRPIEFVARTGYGETIELLRQKRLDVAWVSPSAYLYLARVGLAQLLATPIYRGSPYSHAYLVVSATDNKTRSMIDLAGRVFAYGDIDSFAAYDLPRFELRQEGKNADDFFRKSFLAGFDQHVVEAVADGLADAGSIDGFVWDSLMEVQPNLATALRVAAKSGAYGLPPLVARAGSDGDGARALQRVLIDMSRDPEGTRLLKRLHFDGFIAADPTIYESVVRTRGPRDVP